MELYPANYLWLSSFAKRYHTQRCCPSLYSLTLFPLTRFLVYSCVGKDIRQV
jgi:hypothetical protein